MSHTARMVHNKLESDGAIACLMRCCEDASTDSWHTLYIKPETSSQDVQDWLKERLARTEQQHAAVINARGILERGV